MKTLVFFTLISVFANFLANAEEPLKDKGEVISLSTGMDQIDGTNLMRCDVTSGPIGSKNYTSKSTVGYLTASIDKNKKGEFVPVLALPYLKNDVYVIKVANGELMITTKNSGSMVVSLNIKNLVPSLLSE